MVLSTDTRDKNGKSLSKDKAMSDDDEPATNRKLPPTRRHSHTPRFNCEFSRPSLTHCRNKEEPQQAQGGQVWVWRWENLANPWIHTFVTYAHFHLVVRVHGWREKILWFNQLSAANRFSSPNSKLNFSASQRKSASVKTIKCRFPVSAPVSSRNTTMVHCWCGRRLAMTFPTLA